MRVVIVGAGVVGCAVARRLASLACDVVVIERGSDVAVGTSKANNSHIVCGADVEPGTMEHRMLRASARLFDDVTQELSVRFRRDGALNVAFTASEVEHTLPSLKERASRGGVGNLRILDSTGLRDLRPRISPEARAALLTPDDGVLCSYGLVLALAQNAAENRASFLRSTRVAGLDHLPGRPNPMRVRCLHAECTHSTSDPSTRPRTRTIDAQVVINAAGLYSDEVSCMVGWDDFVIRPRRGEFFVLDRKHACLTRGITYGCPRPDYRGTTLLHTLDGNILVGPTAEDIEDKQDTSTTEAGLAKALAAGQRLFPELHPGMAIAQFAGLRARCPDRDDLIVGWHPDGVTPFINLAGIRSTGISCSLGLAEHVVELLSERFSLEPDPSFVPERSPWIRFAELTQAEQARLIDRDPSFGRVVCRCETVTEGEVIAALRGPLPALDLDGIKRRTRAGMGRCQGGFCTPRLMKLISRELGIPMTAITKRGAGSWLLAAKTKADLDEPGPGSGPRSRAW